MKSTQCVVVSLLTALVAAPGHAQQSKRECPPEPVVAVATSELAAALSTGDGETRITGRSSVYLAATPEDLDSNVVRVGGWNLAFFSVPQAPLSAGQDVPFEQGLLGFATNSDEAMLRYDRESGTWKGKISGFVDTSTLSTIVVERKKAGRPGDDDFYETLTQPATLSIEMKLDGDLAAAGEKVQRARASATADLTVEKMEYAGRVFPSYEVRIRDLRLDFEIVIWRWFEVARRLCVQPVRIGRLQLVYGRWGMPHFYLETTGDGLAFGQPGVSTQWSKADVVFTYRDWKTIWDASYWVTSDAGTEEANLRAEVDDDDCIEVYFVHDFDPVDAHGGGAAWGGGTAGSKIITSDANARNGIDFTHLAHELGHVIGLHHPWESATANLYPASTGTLMCGSGFMNDNPTVNSQENEDHLANPLLTFALKLQSAGPDCQDDSDCGACP